MLTCIQRQTTGLVWQAGSLRPLLQICHLVEGIPLAIELAATLFGHYSGQEIVEHLQDDLTLLSTTSHARAQRHQSMSRVLQDCWDRLSTQEQVLLVRLTLFFDRFSRHAALAVTGSVPETLVALVNKSLVRSKGAGFYEIPRLVRLFANQRWKKFENEEDKTRLQGTHAIYYLTYLQQQLDRSTIHQNEPIISLIEQELSNLRNACNWIHQHGTPQQRQQCTALLSALRQWSRDVQI